MGAVQHELAGRERILQAARSLFADQGFHQTPMAELAVAAQVSVGQIYRLFKGKEDIIAAMVANDTEARLTELTALWSETKSGALNVEQAFEEIIMGVFASSDEALSFDILAEAFRNPNVGATITAMCSELRTILREFACMANPDLSGDALEAAEEMIMACMFGLGHRSLSKPMQSEQVTARWTAKLIVAGLRTVH